MRVWVLKRSKILLPEKREEKKSSHESQSACRLVTKTKTVDKEQQK